ncbi:MAG: glycine cleavage system protein GcvH [Proteobacteria bacterium]|nr:glycine cleavage system protein GcvH [Pseudomonadota bacterium]
MSGSDRLLFSKNHEWVTGTSGEVLVGVSAHAVEQLGDVIYIELPEKGDEFSAGDTFGTIESTKTVSDLYTPISGQVIAVNEDIQSDPSGLQEDPYLDGWLIKLHCSEDDSEPLMTAQEYDDYIKGH